VENISSPIEDSFSHQGYLIRVNNLLLRDVVGLGLLLRQAFQVSFFEKMAWAGFRRNTIFQTRFGFLFSSCLRILNEYDIIAEFSKVNQVLFQHLHSIFHRPCPRCIFQTSFLIRSIRGSPRFLPSFSVFPAPLVSAVREPRPQFSCFIFSPIRAYPSHPWLPSSLPPSCPSCSSWCLFRPKKWSYGALISTSMAF
jgi:hypothetical protein